MKILFNNTIFFDQRFGGISRYFVNLANELEKLNLDYTISAPIYKNLYLKHFNKKRVKGFFVKRYPKNKIIENLNIFFENKIIKKISPNLVHDTYYSCNLYKNFNFKKIITVHDLIHEKLIKYYGMNIQNKLNDKKLAIKNSDFIICVSNTTKKNLIDYYNIAENKIKVVYHGADHLDNINSSNLNISKDFLLYVGSRSKYKNFNLLLNAFSSNEKIKKNFDLICFGGGKFSKNEIENLKKLKIYNNVKLILNNEDAILKYLYLNAKLLVITSEMEGFGIPIIEAMRNKCKILASDIDTFKEIGNDKINYFESKNLDSLIYELESSIFKNNDDLITQALEYSENFKWSKCAKNTFEIYSKMK